MSAIAGYVDFAGAAPAPDVLGAMTACLGHRGPDGAGVAVRGPCGLGHARLGVIDPRGGEQPLHAPDSPITIAFGGTIYNYKSLRAELGTTGQRFATDGDAEVLLRLLERDGIDGLPRLDGAFAIAAWNEREQRLLLARDPFGVEPLYYATPRPGLLIFASEPKAIFEHPASPPELDPESLRGMLRYGAVYGERTLHAGVRRLEPGTWVTFGRHGTERGCFYDLVHLAAEARRSHTGQPASELIAGGRQLLEEAVRRRLVADVPVGVLLSGGVDGALIAAIAQSAADQPIHSFSVGFAGDPRSELPQARRAAEAIGTRHCDVEVSESDCLDTLSSMSWYRDAPLAEPTDFAIARMSRAARDHVKVVLSGAGADEVFCGHPKYRFAEAGSELSGLARLLGPARLARCARLAGITTYGARVAARALSCRTMLERLTQWYAYLDRAALADLMPGLGWEDEHWQRTMAPQAAVLDAVGTIAADGLGSVGTLAMQAVDVGTWLPGNLLDRSDRLTASASLELRVPFLDRTLVPFGLGLPRRMKVRGTTLKWIVRRWARELVPAPIARRPWRGFRVPLGTWFRGTLGLTLEDYLDSPRGLCGLYGDALKIRGLLDAHRAGKTDAGHALWTLLAAEVWYQDVFQRRRHRARPDQAVAWTDAGRRAA